MAAPRFLNIVLGRLKQIATIATSAGAGDAEKIPSTDSSGKLDISFMPSGVGNTKSITTSEALSAGDMVNIHISSGVKARKADNTSAAKYATHFVISSFSSGASALLYPLGSINTGVSGLTAGTEYWLGATGGLVIAGSLPSSAGNLHQFIGVALSATELGTVSSPPVELV
jgi:hypothetical protein